MVQCNSILILKDLYYFTPYNFLSVVIVITGLNLLTRCQNLKIFSIVVFKYFDLNYEKYFIWITSLKRMEDCLQLQLSQNPNHYSMVLSV